MITLINRVKFYNNPQQMPIEREWLFKKYLMMCNMSLHDPYEACMKVSELIQQNALDNAVSMCRNWYQSIYMNVEAFDPASYSFATLIHSVDGVERNDLSEEGLHDTLNLIKGELTRTEILKQIADVKKN